MVTYRRTTAGFNAEDPHGFNANSLRAFIPLRENIYYSKTEREKERDKRVRRRKSEGVRTGLVSDESLLFELFVLNNKKQLVSGLLTFKATYVYIVRGRERRVEIFQNIKVEGARA